MFLNNFGLGDKEEVRGYQDGRQAFLGSAGLDDGNARDRLLPIKRLDGYIPEKGIERVDFLKVDTEGFDLKVLIGGVSFFHIIKFIQYEHWGEVDNRMIKGLLAPEFDCYDVGYRNVFCMNRNLVSEEERSRLKTYIRDNKLGELV